MSRFFDFYQRLKSQAGSIKIPLQLPSLEDNQRNFDSVLSKHIEDFNEGLKQYAPQIEAHHNDSENADERTRLENELKADLPLKQKFNELMDYFRKTYDHLNIVSALKSKFTTDLSQFTQGLERFDRIFNAHLFQKSLRFKNDAPELATIYVYNHYNQKVIYLSQQGQSLNEVSDEAYGLALKEFVDRYKITPKIESNKTTTVYTFPSPTFRDAFLAVLCKKAEEEKSKPLKAQVGMG